MQCSLNLGRIRQKKPAVWPVQLACKRKPHCFVLGIVCDKNFHQWQYLYYLRIIMILPLLSLFLSPSLSPSLPPSPSLPFLYFGCFPLVCCMLWRSQPALPILLHTYQCISLYSSVCLLAGVTHKSSRTTSLLVNKILTTAIRTLDIVLLLMYCITTCVLETIPGVVQ